MIQTLFGPPQKAGLFERVREKMSGAVQKTRENLTARVDELLRGQAEVSPELLRGLETALIAADVGAAAAAEIVGKLREEAARDPRAWDGDRLRARLQDELAGLLDSVSRPLAAAPDGQPLVVMLVGVNGTGKTTTLGKLSRHYRQAGGEVLLCAADTFRAAAIEQLEIWGERTGSAVIRQQPGADPSAVIYDALQAARARGANYVLVDTAGRLHTKSNLMQELSKMRRTAARLVPGAPHETLLVLDATTGQNGLQQARLFGESAGLTGIIVTKLDGTARGGIVVAIARELGLPVRFAGVGEAADDLIPFDPRQFAASLFAPADQPL